MSQVLTYTSRLFKIFNFLQQRKTPGLQQAVRSDKVLNNNPRTSCDTIKLSALDPENIYPTLKSLKNKSKTKANFNQKEEVNYKHT